jgi:DNA-binding NarL/FixJ family response regulator
MIAKRILIIEDDHSLAKTLKNVLLANNYETEVANSGSEGIQKAYEYCPDLILCDINMSPINGYQVFNILKETNLTKRIPFIFITGRSDLQDIRLGLELGVDDYIIKPFKNENLLKSVKVRLEKYEYLIEIGRSKYQSFIANSPNGIFIFDGTTIYECNSAFLQMTSLTEEKVKEIAFYDLVGQKKYKSIDELIVKCTNGLMDCFKEVIKLKTSSNKNKKYNLYVNPSQKYNGFALLIGLIVPVNEPFDSVQIEYNKLINILEEEKIDVTEHLVHRIHQEFDFSDNKRKQKEMSTFSEIELSKREQEVLALSCQGLPIKNIAEKLFISDRTVESHRASLMEKTGAKNIIEVIIYALKHELIEI